MTDGKWQKECPGNANFVAIPGFIFFGSNTFRVGE